MKHGGCEIKDEQAQAPSGRGESSKENKNTHWDRAEHPQQASKNMPLVDVAEAGNDTEDDCYSVAGLGFCSLCRVAYPIAPFTTFRVSGQKVPAIRAGHLIACGRFRLGSWSIRIFDLHIYETHKPHRIRQANRIKAGTITHTVLGVALPDSRARLNDAAGRSD